MLQQIYPVVEHSFKFELNKDMNWSAAHFIPHDDAGKCANVHGHTYFVNITIVGDELNYLGFLTNFQALKKLAHGRYDHTLMNQHEEFADSTVQLVAGLPTPSTEYVAQKIASLIQEHLDKEGNGAWCLQVFVRETPTSYVVFRPQTKEDYHFPTIQDRKEHSGDFRQVKTDEE